MTHAWCFIAELKSLRQSSRPTQENDYASLSPLGATTETDVTDDVTYDDDDTYMNDVDLKTLARESVTDDGCSRLSEEACDVIESELNDKGIGHQNNGYDGTVDKRSFAQEMDVFENESTFTMGISDDVINDDDTTLDKPHDDAADDVDDTADRMSTNSMSLYVNLATLKQTKPEDATLRRHELSSSRDEDTSTPSKRHVTSRDEETRRDRTSRDANISKQRLREVTLHDEDVHSNDAFAAEDKAERIYQNWPPSKH